MHSYYHSRSCGQQLNSLRCGPASQCKQDWPIYSLPLEILFWKGMFQPKHTYPRQVLKALQTMAKLLHPRQLLKLALSIDYASA